ncbi:hypothetical protein TWF192_011023 [Orbilia oligospora]|uniref:F-box domain-containing protein n=1 Tax=Orbilia oligospora TaxID=2813651 RepID=A0A6G1MHH4_ORBOL|nr:hypothetical protein TWF191_003649 [Orbilia oligospora]KAF3258887.1 hypothetical protein TWF192_011023 [Orbilia oligospora]
MTPTPPLNKLERISRELQEVFMKTPNRWPSNSFACQQKSSFYPRSSNFSDNNGTYKGNPCILKLPLEILQTIAGFLPAPGDAINLASTCSSLRTNLGPPNRLFWFQVLKRKVTKYRRFNRRTNYYSVVLDHLAGKLKGCQVCLFQGRNCDIRVSGIFYKSLCLDCKKQIFWDWHHTCAKYPEIDFPETFKATCSSHNPCLHRPSIRIRHAVQVIEEECIPSLPNFKSSSQPDHRFLSKWNFRLSKLQELGTSIVFLSNFLTDFYTSLYPDFHVLKSPAQFRHFVEMRFLEVVSDPTTHFRSRYPHDLYDLFYSTVVRLMCFRSSPYKVLSSETAVSTGDILYELLGNNIVTSTFFPSTKKPLILSKWIKDYVSDHPEKGFRSRTCLGRFTWCCFCRNGTFDRAAETVASDDHLQTLSETAYSRQGLAEHIFKYHNHRFAQTWEWCPVH